MMENSAFHLYESVLNRVFMRFETLLELKTAVGADLPCETGLASPPCQCYTIGGAACIYSYKHVQFRWVYRDSR
jgi:hypothetical protein